MDFCLRTFVIDGVGVVQSTETLAALNDAFEHFTQRDSSRLNRTSRFL
jgi:hypothetical protein